MRRNGDQKQDHVGRRGEEGEYSRGTEMEREKQRYREDVFRETRLLWCSSGAWDRFRVGGMGFALDESLWVRALGDGFVCGVSAEEELLFSGRFESSE